MVAHCCREVFPIISITTSLGKEFCMPMGDTKMNISVHEGNVGALVLARTFSPQFNPRSKYYATKTILFREEIVKRSVNLLRIDNIYHLGDLFTKGLTITTFE